MSTDTKWIIGTVLVVAGMLSAQIAVVSNGLNARIDDLRADLGGRMDRLEARIDRMEAHLEARIDGLDERLRNVEIAIGRLDQRLLTIERIVLPAPEPPAPPGARAPGPPRPVRGLSPARVPHRRLGLFGVGRAGVPKVLQVGPRSGIRSSCRLEPGGRGREKRAAPIRRRPGQITIAISARRPASWTSARNDGLRRPSRTAMIPRSSGRTRSPNEDAGVVGVAPMRRPHERGPYWPTAVSPSHSRAIPGVSSSPRTVGTQSASSSRLAAGPLAAEAMGSSSPSNAC